MKGKLNSANNEINNKNHNKTPKKSSDPESKELTYGTENNLSLSRSTSPLPKNDIENESSVELDLQIMVAEGYFLLKSYTEAWISACRCALSYDEPQERITKLQLNILIATDKRKLAQQIAFEYERKKGFAPFLANFYLENAKLFCKENNFSSAKISIDKAIKCAGKTIIAKATNADPILKKLL